MLVQTPEPAFCPTLRHGRTRPVSQHGGKGGREGLGLKMPTVRGERSEPGVAGTADLGIPRPSGKEDGGSQTQGGGEASGRVAWPRGSAVPRNGDARGKWLSTDGETGWGVSPRPPKPAFSRPEQERSSRDSAVPLLPGPCFPSGLVARSPGRSDLAPQPVHALIRSLFPQEVAAVIAMCASSLPGGSSLTGPLLPVPPGTKAGLREGGWLGQALP